MTDHEYLNLLDLHAAVAIAVDEGMNLADQLAALRRRLLDLYRHQRGLIEELRRQVWCSGEMPLS